MEPELPACCLVGPDATLAQRLYAAYNRGGPADKAGLNYQSLPCPEWQNLPETVRQSGRRRLKKPVNNWQVVQD